MFNLLQRTITGWPGGKPNVPDTERPERAEPAVKRVILFSPHPDDDVISMGGTFLRLVEQEHDVHVAYQTSGNIAVADKEALRFAEFAAEINQVNGVEDKILASTIERLRHPDPAAEADPKDVLKVKGLIRRGEATAGARFVGLRYDHIHFLDLPFYETGKSEKDPPSQKDVDITVKLIKEVRPQQIFAAGDLADPHGTHKVCLDIIFAALEQLKGDPSIADTYLWLYRGAWQEWRIHEIEMAIPLSPQEVDKKRQAIFFYQSQKDGVMFQGEDDRKFWQRAEQRNRETARAYNELGLTEYEAIEAFRRWPI